MDPSEAVFLGLDAMQVFAVFFAPIVFVIAVLIGISDRK